MQPEASNERPPESVAPRPRRPLAVRVLVRLFAVALSTLVALALGEVLARLRPAPERYDPEYVPDPAAFHRPRPGYVNEKRKVRVNAHGFRDPEDFPLEKPAGEARLLFLGDSFLFANDIAFEDTFPERARQGLAKTTGLALRSINSGCPSNGPQHELAVLERYGLATHPDVVVLCFYVGNDVLDTFTLDWPGFVPDEEHFLQFQPPRQASLQRRILEHSRLAALIESTDAYQGYLRWREQRKQLAKGGHSFTQGKLYDFQYRTISQWRRGAWTRPPLDEAWRRADAAVQGVFATARAAGATPVLLVIPDELQCDPAARAGVCEEFHLDEKDYDLEQPQTHLRELAAKEGVLVVDALALCRERTKTTRLYFELDAHWNTAGDAVAGELLAGALEPIVVARAKSPR